MSSRLVIGFASGPSPTRGFALDRGARLEERLVEIGQLQLVVADAPDAFLAEGIERRQLLLGDLVECGCRRQFRSASCASAHERLAAVGSAFVFVFMRVTILPARLAVVVAARRVFVAVAVR